MTSEENGFLSISRRDALKGAGFVALGLGGATDVALAGPSSKYGWLVTHSNYGRTPPRLTRRNGQLIETEDRIRSIHTLEYLGAQWDPYISPESESEGSWHHSFRLAAFAGTNHVRKTAEDGEVVSRSFDPRNRVTGTELRVRTEDAALAIAPRRDAGLYGFLTPDGFEDVLRPVTVPAGGDTSLSGVEQITRALATDPGTAVAPDYLRNRREMALTGGGPATDVAKILAFGPLPDLIDNAPTLTKTLDSIGKLDALVDIWKALNVEFDYMNEGFDYEYPYENNGPGGAHYVYFDAYVPRGTTARFTVESRFDTTLDYSDPAADDLNRADTPAWENAHPQWEIQVSGPSSGTDRTEAAKPRKWNRRVDYETETTVPVYRKDPDEQHVEAALDITRAQVEPGESFTADASDSTSPVAGDLRYDLSAYRAFGYGDGPYPTSDSTAGRRIVHGSTAELDVTERSDGVYEVGLDVEESSLGRYYDVEVAVTDSRGVTDTATDYVYVPPTLPRAHLQIPDVVGQGDTVTLDASDTEGYVEPGDYEWSVSLVEVGPHDRYGEPVEYPGSEPELGPISVETPVEWDLAGEVPEHTLGEPLAEKRLVYEIQLTATSSINPDQADSITKYLTVAPAPNHGPSAAITLDGQFVGGKRLTLDGSDSSDPNGVKDITAYDWTITRQSDDWSETRTGEVASLDLPCSETEYAYTVELTVTDDDGETGTATANFTVPGMEDPGPEVDLTYEPAEPIVDDDTVSYTASVSGTEGTPTYQWAYSDPGDDTITTVDGGETFQRPYHETGEAFVSVTVTDDCGSQSDDAFVQVLPNPEPTVTLDGPASATEGETVTYTATVDDDQPIADIQWSVFHPDESIADAGSGTEFTYRFDDASDVTIGVMVTDQDGATASDDVQVSVNDLPNVSLSGPSTVSANSSHDYEASVPNDSVAEYTWSDPNGTTTTTERVHTVNFGSTDGTVSVTATDPQGASASASIDVTVNEGPTVSLDGPTSATEGETVTFTADASDPDGDSLSYQWTYGQDPLETQSGGTSISATVTDSSTDFFVNVTVEDPAGATDSASRTIDVEPQDTNDAPSVSLSGPSSATEGDSVTFTANASDPDGDSLSYQWTYGQDPLETQSGGTSITDTVTDSSSDFFVNVTVEDSHGATADASEFVPVYDDNDAPSVSISYSPSSPVTYETVSISASASDPDGDSLSYSWSGASISGSSGTESWSTKGYKDVSVTVTDGHGHSARDSVTIYVADSGIEQSTMQNDGLLDTIAAGSGPFALAAAALLGKPRDDVEDAEVDR